MNVIAINPKLEFKLRTLQNWVICIAGFALWVLIVSPFPFRWLADAAGIAVAWYVLFYVLDKRACLITCPECTKPISTNTPWICGVAVCGKHNLKVDDYPFTHKCEHCGVEPKAYRCHHKDCGELIFFTEDQQAVNVASCLSAKEPPPPDRKAERAESKEAKAHEVELQELELKLDGLKREAEQRNKKPKPLNEEIHDDLDRFFTRRMGYEEHAKKKKAQVDEMYKDDPEGKQKAYDAIDAWLREKI